MATPFALSIEDLAQLWNAMIEGSKIKYSDAEVPAGAITLHIPDYGAEHDVPIRNMSNLLMMYVATVIGTYDERLSHFLREKNLI